MYSLGSIVRVTLEQQQSRQATVAAINDDGCVDVIYEANAVGTSIEEEDNVNPSRISQLLEFEIETDRDSSLYKDPMTMKEYGNKVFAVKDYETAIRYYLRGVAALQLPAISIGVSVIVAPSKGSSSLFTVGMVADCCEGSSLDIVYDESEECDVHKSRLTVLHPVTSSRSLQRSLYSNLSKCYHALRKFGLSAFYASLAVELLKSLREDEDVAKTLTDMHIVRCRALLAANRPGDTT